LNYRLSILIAFLLEVIYFIGKLADPFCYLIIDTGKLLSAAILNN
jgi:hypothetical protein